MTDTHPMTPSFDGAQNIGVVVVVIRGKYCLAGIRTNAYKSGWYGLPGGRVEVGEPLETCGRRELAEETGLVPVSMAYAGIVREWQGGYDFMHVVYVCREFTGEPAVMEPHTCRGWEWVPRDGLPDHMLPGHKAAVSLAASRMPALIDFPRH